MTKPICSLIIAALALTAVTAVAHPGASSAIEHYSHKLEHKPKDQALHIQRGIAYSNDGQYDKALVDFERAEELGEPVLVAFDRGVLHYRHREFDKAKGYFDNYLVAFPNSARCLEYRARVLRDMGDYAGSVADFRQFFALEASPNPGHYVSAAKMLAESGGEGINQALQLLDEGIAQLGLTPTLQGYAIELELERGRTDLAIQRQESLEPMLGKSPDWKVDMAELQLWDGNSTEASKLLQDAGQQLDSLRKTPARQALRERIAELSAVAV